jgi:predicted porin
MLRKLTVCVLGAIAAATALSGTVLAQDARDPYFDPCPVWSETELGFGYWGSHTTGSPVKTGEYQDLSASPFYNVDTLRSDGCRTLNFSMTGTDEETNAASLNYFGPAVEANIEYQRFVHNYGHDNLGQFTDSGSTAASTQPLIRQDLNTGEDYAIRVQEFKESFKARLTDDIKVRLDVWGIYKEGERQADSTQECYHYQTAGNPPTGGGSHCHILSQMQHIDWQTTEVKPVVEWNLGPVVIEYSRPMRTFNQSDQTVERYYAFEGFPASYSPYSLVPDNTTQIDQLKLSAEVNDCNRLYTFFYTGNTRSEGEGVQPGGTIIDEVNNRRMNGADVRWTNTAIDNLTITPYARYVKEINDFSDSADTTFPVNYERSQVGVRSQWRPFGGGFGLGGLAISSEYEHGDLHRANLDFPQDSINADLDEEHTISNIFSIGPSVRWSPCLNTYLKYKYYNSDDALYGVAYHSSSYGQPFGDTFEYTAQSTNTALPEHDNIVELGGTWLPSNNFMLNGWVGIDAQSQSEGQLVISNSGTPPPTTTPVVTKTPLTFKSDNYPCGFNGSYQAGDQWTLNFGAAYYTNWIDQDQVFGPGSTHGFGSPPAATEYGALVNRIAYGGRAGVLNLGFTYRFSPRLRFIGQGEYVHGIDSAYQLSGDPNFPATNSSTAQIPGIYRDDVVITRVSAGVDYQLSKRWSTYFRYVFFDYQDSADKAQLAASTTPVDGLPLSGTSNLFLGGVNATF